MVALVLNQRIKRSLHLWQSYGQDDSEKLSLIHISIEWDAEAAEKGGYEHFMIKEIHEQQRAVRDTLNSVIRDDHIDLTEAGLSDDVIRSLKRIYIVACGSAYHAGVAAQYVIEDLARIPVRVELASEFRYRNPILEENSLVIIISQSGETADSLAALRLAKSQGCLLYTSSAYCSGSASNTGMWCRRAPARL